jgi:hypothetical protein
VLPGNATPKENVKKKPRRKYPRSLAKRKRNERQQQIPEKREERGRNDRNCHQIQRAAEEVEADHVRRRVEETHHGIRLNERTRGGINKVVESTSEANAE